MVKPSTVKNQKNKEIDKTEHRTPTTLLFINGFFIAIKSKIVFHKRNFITDQYLTFSK